MTGALVRPAAGVMQMKSIRTALLVAVATMFVLPAVAQAEPDRNWRRGDRPTAVRDDAAEQPQRPAPAVRTDTGDRRAEWRANRERFSRGAAPQPQSQLQVQSQPQQQVQAPVQPAQYGGNRGQWTRGSDATQWRRTDGQVRTGDARGFQNDGRSNDGRWDRGNGATGQRDGQWNRETRDGQTNHGRWDRNDRNDRNDGNGRWDNDRRGDHQRDGNRYGRYDNRPNLNWRNDHRYDWRGFRNSHRDVFNRGRYHAPRGYNYRSVYRGFFLDSFFYGSNYWLSDPYEYRLPPVDWPYRWVRYYNDALLVDTTTGEVVDVIQNIFW
ncbi:MAG TPA: RcnB family protein [Sphingomonas sp.]|nr:RcnB family protein [Sphingomonas sp.]